MAKQFVLPGSLKEFLCIDELESGEFFVSDLFRHKFGHSPPNFGKHIVLFYRTTDRTFRVASYLHLWTAETIGLIGGGCTDGRSIRLMSDAERLAIDNAGGLLLQTLRYAFDRHEGELHAFFGHCGNDRALAVDLRAGFTRTDDPHLLVRWNRDLTELERATLYQRALALGSF